MIVRCSGERGARASLQRYVGDDADASRADASCVVGVNMLHAVATLARACSHARSAFIGVQYRIYGFLLYMIITKSLLNSY